MHTCSGSLIRGTDQPTTPLLISNESSTILETVIQVRFSVETVIQVISSLLVMLQLS